jgi:phage repressor protein C with HTH and peptisase S24 domain
MALKHQDIWRAIDLLAETRGLTASGLAKMAGLDATSFNLSKRTTPDGRARWPSTETLAKVFHVTGENIDRLPQYLSGRLEDAPTASNMTHKQPGQIPLLGYAQAGQEGYFDDAGFPVGEGWDLISLLPQQDPNVYALEVSGSSMEPLYREGDVLIVSPTAENIRRGDRVVVRTREGEVMAKQLMRLTSAQVVLKSLNDSFKDIIMPRENLHWMARILWVSQ